MEVTLIRSPSEDDWIQVKRRALITVGKKPITLPDSTWKHSILGARHSPIRYLTFSYSLEGVPYWVAMHLRTHVHAQCYIRSQRNDVQNMYDRNDAPQSTPVDMIMDVNAEELMNIANKRLCAKASSETRDVVRRMCDLATDVCPELDGLLVPNCMRHGNICYEMKPCRACVSYESILYGGDGV